MDDQALMDVLDRLRNRFFGKYRGVVTDVDAATLRIKAKVPAVLADQPTGWCRACVPYRRRQRRHRLPAGGGVRRLDRVRRRRRVVSDLGRLLLARRRDAGDAAPAVKAIVTKSGHKIVLDDDAATITISDQNGNSITLDSDGITLSAAAARSRSATPRSTSTTAPWRSI